MGLVSLVRRRILAKGLVLACAAALVHCASPQVDLSDLQRVTLPERTPEGRQPTDAATAHVLMLGEQHDAPAHQALHASTVAHLIAQGRLSGVVIEMVDSGANTRNVAATASEAEVQQALGWREAAWPWATYGPAIMPAVRAGVPVYGGNLPYAEMRDVMREASWDTRVNASAFAFQLDAVAAGHCNLLPTSQLRPMARIQVARDARMADTLKAVVQAGHITLFIAGSAHTAIGTGVPLHLQQASVSEVPVVVTSVLLSADGRQGVSAHPEGDYDWVWHTPETPPQDYCAALRAQMKR